MKYIILISNPNYQLSNMREMVSGGMDSYINENDDVLSIKVNDGYVSIRRADDVLHDFDDSEIKIIKSTLIVPEIYLVNYKDIADVKQVLKYVADRDDVLIDTDTGLLLTGKEFNKMCTTRPGWDWLQEHS